MLVLRPLRKKITTITLYSRVSDCCPFLRGILFLFLFLFLLLLMLLLLLAFLAH